MLTGFSKGNIPELLLKENLITSEELEKAFELEKKTGDSLESILINMDFVNAKDFTRIKGKAIGVPFIDLDEVEPEEEALRMIPKVSTGFKVIPVSIKPAEIIHRITELTLKQIPDEIDINPLRKLLDRELAEEKLQSDLSQLNYTEKEIEIILSHTTKTTKNKMVLAMVDPLNNFALDEIQRCTWYAIEPAIATEESIIKAIDKYFFTGDFEEDTGEIIKETPWYKNVKITEGSMAVKKMENVLLPLKYTEVKANIIGMLADVKVTQKFYNDLSENIEAIYMFPLPHESAVNEFEIVTGDRVIKSVVKEKQEARKIYEKAKLTGKKAGLLEQERPNIFTVSIANIEPGQVILVNIRYYETVKYEDNNYEFVFPMTITPRYGGEDKKGVPESLGGKTSHPLIHPAKSAGREVNISINLDAGFESGNISSPSHLLYVQEKGKTEREIQLAREGEIPNKDFILKYSSKGEKEETAVSFYREENRGGTFMLHLTPKMDYGPEEIIKREIIFVLDRSGSMCGTPIEQARRALKNCLRTLRPGDNFSVITFDHEIECLSERSLEFNDENLKLADKFINNINPRGGTEILSALKYAFQVPALKGHLRQIVFLTDGAVWNEEESLQEINKSLGDCRIFSFGIGPAVNRYFLKKIAELGRGTCQFITTPEEIKESVDNFAIQMSSPIISDISLIWEGANIADVYPEPVPDLYFGQVLCLLGRFHSYGQIKGCLTGRVREGTFRQEFTVELPEKDTTHPVIETIWARKHIDLLMDQQRKYPQKRSEIRDEIIGICLKYHLMSQYTSLVAVEDEKEESESSRPEKDLITIEVPQILPEGLNYDSFDTSPPLTAEDLDSGSTSLGEVEESVRDIALTDFGYIEIEDEDDMELDKCKELVDEAPIIRVTNLIITQAILDRADYIHIDPKAKNISVRYRIDGISHDVMTPPKHIQSLLLSRIKTMAGLDTSESDIPQHGKIHLNHDGVDYDLTVWTLPTVHGEKVVIRILDKAYSLLEPDKSGLTPEKEKLFQTLLSKEKGMIILTGPSESGKTTTLYSALNMLKETGKHICILKDHPPYEIPGINIIEPVEEIEKTLKDILNQDHQIIMIEDICKKETAEITLKAATKHLLLTSLPGNNTSDAVRNLLSMGIDPILISSVLKGVIARRLIRQVCPDCKKAYTPEKEILRKLGFKPGDNSIFYQATGCDKCKGTGYKGRCGISEIMVVNDDIRSLILKEASSDEIRDCALKSGMVTPGEEVRNLLLQGLTTIEEYFKM